LITYPILKKEGNIGVTAPSSGVPSELHELIKQASKRMTEKGFNVTCGETIWTQKKAKSAPARKRAEEFNQMMQDPTIDLVIPPWGGELLIEMLEHVEFEKLDKKWLLGYSDTSMLLLAITLKIGMATAHGTNLVDLRGEFSDDTTGMWESVLTTKTGESILQHSSDLYQKQWDHGNPSPCVFHLTEKTSWKTIANEDVNIEGRLLGGCIDIVRHLIGTPYGDVDTFRKQFINEEPVIWYFENCELSTTDLRRTLIQMKLAGWFKNCSGILFGRSATNIPVNDYTLNDVYKELADELQIPIVYDIDCGHVPPQLTLINGAFAEVKVTNGQGTVLQHFK
jgi:muramoyltetrapeptide carboxypeptidase